MKRGRQRQNEWSERTTVKRRKEDGGEVNKEGGKKRERGKKT